MSRSVRNVLYTVTSLNFVCAALILCYLPSKSRAEGAAAATVAPDAAGGELHTVARQRFVTKLSIKGAIEARRRTEVALRPETWSDFPVLDAVKPGARVEEGGRLVTLDLRKVDEAIRELQDTLEVSRLSIQQAEQELEILEKSSPLDQEAAERAMKKAREDLGRFLEVDRPLSEKNARFSLKSSEDYLAYAREELRQLLKMYEADDLTEETEEIVLRRQRDTVERAEFALEGATVRLDQTLKVTLPREEERLKEAAQRQTLAWQKAQRDLPLEIGKKRLALDKLKYTHSKDSDRLDKLRRDREAMMLRSPAGGIVYYGKCVRGTWPDTTTVASKLRYGGKLLAHEVFMTIVRARPIFISAAVEEANLHLMQPGLKGKATPTGYPDTKVAVTLETLAAIPTAPGQFDATFAVDEDADLGSLMPGMTCSLELVPYLKEDAIVVPASALVADEVAGTTHVVVSSPEQPSEKRRVRVGKRSGETVEVLDGLKEGEKVRLQKSGS